MKKREEVERYVRPPPQKKKDTGVQWFEDKKEQYGDEEHEKLEKKGKDQIMEGHLNSIRAFRHYSKKMGIQ